MTVRREKHGNRKTNTAEDKSNKAVGQITTLKISIMHIVFDKQWHTQKEKYSKCNGTMVNYQQDEKPINTCLEES